MDLAKSIEGGLNGIHGIKVMMTGSREARAARKQFSDRMREFIPDDEIYDMLLPNFAVGCRRLTPGGKSVEWKVHCHLRHGFVTV